MEHAYHSGTYHHLHHRYHQQQQQHLVEKRSEFMSHPALVTLNIAPNE